MSKTRLLFLVILIEGYVVLATELIAIRSLIPFVGSGTEIISIIISAVLLPLAIGYHAGGNASAGKKSIRKILMRNVAISLIILTIGLSYIFQELFFGFMEFFITSRLLQTAIYSMLFLSYPVYLLGQTVPLVSNYFSRDKLSQITGKMLFFSTTGSFLGSVFSTIVLMTYVGVHNTVIVTLTLLCLLILLLARNIAGRYSVFCAAVLVIIFSLNNNGVMSSLGIVSNNAYNLVGITTTPIGNKRIISVNRSTSSILSPTPPYTAEYITYIEDNFIYSAREEVADKKLDILVIGAGGFTIGRKDTYNNYTFVDIDSDLKDIAEEHFLKEKLTANKKFMPMSARAFLNKKDKKYDLVLIDVYTNKTSIPMECTTQEFFAAVRKVMKPRSVLVSNVAGSATFADLFTVRYHNTFASVFPVFSRQVIQSLYKSAIWGDNTTDQIKNVLYIVSSNEYASDRTIYTDDKNSYSLDMP